MQNHSVFKNAIETFQSANTDSPILLSVTTRDDKAFKVLLGRKLQSRPFSVLEWVATILLIVAVVVALVALSAGGASAGAGGAFGGIFAALYVSYFLRTSLISVSADGLDFYFAEKRRGSKYVVYDKMSLPYDKITNVKVRRGPFNTSFRFELSNDGKKYKLATSVPNKKRKIVEQAGHLNSLLEVLEQKNLYSK